MPVAVGPLRSRQAAPCGCRRRHRRLRLAALCGCRRRQLVGRCAPSLLVAPCGGLAPSLLVAPCGGLAPSPIPGPAAAVVAVASFVALAGSSAALIAALCAACAVSLTAELSDA